ncbi:MAG TPA: hypothetical protein VIQ24_13355 [Pyrinomonadaceae bacterium]
MSGTLILFMLAASAADALAQKRSRAKGAAATTTRATTRVSPRFDDYPVREVYRGRIAPVILDTKRARRFRSRLREDSRQGVNFAGHYTVVFWGCGTGCAQLAVVDAKTGRVYWPPVEYTDIPPEPSQADPAHHPNFRPGSKLLVLTRSHYDARGSRTAYYYLFDKNRFRLLRQAEERDPD